MKDSHEGLSRIATGDGHGENSPYFDGWKAYDKNPFHPLKNPNGVIQMGLAENQLCLDLIQDWMEKNPQASICTYEGISSFKNIAAFQDYHGLPEFRKAIAKFMSRVRGGQVTFDPDRVVMSSGATGANELVMFCLADPGDAFLVPTPYYAGFDRDLRWRTGVQIIPVDCSSKTDFKITKRALEIAYHEASQSGTKIKGVIISNPSNPLGTTLDVETLNDLVDFINEKNIHLVCDEIYSATVFKSPSFLSVSEIITKKTCNLDLIHVVYSLSKDMGLPGFRIGIVYSYNDAVVRCARKMSSFGLVSSQTQYLISVMLSDEDFVNSFLVESKRRLERRHNMFTTALEELGIPCLKSNAGLFVWMNLHHLLEEQSFDGEMKLWRLIINDVKLNVSPGSSFHCMDPGWFRVCFANMDDETVGIAVQRISWFVGKKKENDKTSKGRKWQRNLRLSFSSLKIEDESAHSPLLLMSPCSPLLLATG